VNALVLIGAAIVFSIAFLIQPILFLHVYVLFKPIIDSGVTFLGAAPRLAAGVALPILAFLYAVFGSKRLYPLPFLPLVAAYLGLYVLAFARFGPYTVEGLAIYLRAALPVLFYVAAPSILSAAKDVDRLILFTAWSGLLSAGMVLLQALGMMSSHGKQDLLVVGSSEMLRHTGGFFDAFSAALPIIVAVICLLYVIQTRKSVRYYSFLALYLIAVFFTVHRMSTIVLVVILSIWLIYNRKVWLGLALLMVLGLAAPSLVVFVPEFLGNVDIVTIIEPQSGGDGQLTLSSGALHGRGWLWQFYLEKFFQASIAEQLFGLETTERGPHNDYLRVLLNLGVLGLAVQLILYGAIGVKLGTLVGRRIGSDQYSSQLYLTAFFFWIFCVLSSLTLAVGLLSTLMWYFWIFSGLALAHQGQSLRRPSHDRSN
jgi:hypothetical protein